jgi:thioredoxin reductase
VITGEEVVSRFAQEIDYLEFARVFDKAERVEKAGEGYRVHTRAGAVHECRTLIVASGARGRLLNVPGEKEYMMRGLCYSAISYAPLFVERQTAVIGDGALALRATAELARIASKVTLVAASHGELDSALGRRVAAAGNVSVLEGYTVERVNGDDYARSLVLARAGEKHELAADAFFVELDLVPQSELVAEIVDRDERGRIKVDCANRTSAAGVFAAGDVTNVFAEQVLIAIGEGAKAALAAHEYLLTQ